MNTTLTRLILLLALLLTLPLQGMSAIAMPTCHLQTQSMDMDHAQHAMVHCDQHLPDHHQPARQASCDQCLFCHLGSIQSTMSQNWTMMPPGTLPVLSLLVVASPDYFPPSLYHPPRPLLS